MMSTEAANCLSCHFQGEFPVDRGLSELGKMAPNLNNVARRLRPEWVKAWLLRPQNWMPYTKMTAFWATSDRPKDASLWPTEQDPFISKTPEWKQAAGPEGVTSEMQAEMVRDFLFGLAPDAKFPRLPRRGPRQPPGQDPRPRAAQGRSHPRQGRQEGQGQEGQGRQGQGQAEDRTGPGAGPPLVLPPGRRSA